MEYKVMRREVVIPVVELMCECLEERGYDAHAFCVRAGLPGGRAALSTFEYVSWEFFNNLLELMRLEAPDEDWANLVSARFVELPLTNGLRGILQKVSDPIWIYIGLNKGFGPSQFLCLTGELEKLSANKVRIHMRLDSPTPILSELFVSISQRSMERMPEVFMGLEQARGSYCIERPEYFWHDIELPASRSIWSRLQMVGQVLKGEDAIVEEFDAMERQLTMLTDRVAELNLEEERMEQRIRERTRELERLNKELIHARDEAQSESRAKTTYLANISHEVRTPLNAIIGGAEMVMEEMEDAGEDAYVEDMERINQAGRHLLRLIEHVLDLSKIEADRMELVPEVILVKSFLEETIAPLELLARQDDTTIELQYESARKVIHADPLRLRQILTNLLSNALKFGKGHTVWVRVHDCEEEEEMLCFDVRDEGVGMSPDVLEKVFLPFQQADDGVQKRFGGTGLGLTISWEFAQLMGGDLLAASVEGDGSTFTLRLPWHQA